MKVIEKDISSFTLQKEYKLKGDNNEIYNLNMKYEKEIFSFECKREDILYKKELKLIDFKLANKQYLSFNAPVFFFQQHLCKLNDNEIEIKSDNNKIIVNIIPEYINQKTKTEIVLNPEIKINEENKLNEIDNFKIAIIKKYPKNIFQLTQRKYIFDIIIKNNYDLYLDSNNHIINEDSIEEINNIINNKSSLMEILIIYL